jgi:sec-independent protein translocase protein TatA
LFNIGPAEMIVILIIALIVFGPKRLPEIGRTVGKGLREFRRASQDIRDEFEGSLQDEPETPAAEPAKSAGEPNLSETETGATSEGAGSNSLDGSTPTA